MRAANWVNSQDLTNNKHHKVGDLNGNPPLNDEMILFHLSE